MSNSERRRRRLRPINRGLVSERVAEQPCAGQVGNRNILHCPECQSTTLSLGSHDQMVNTGQASGRLRHISFHAYCERGHNFRVHIHECRNGGVELYAVAADSNGFSGYFGDPDNLGEVTDSGTPSEAPMEDEGRSRVIALDERMGPPPAPEPPRERHVATTRHTEALDPNLNSLLDTIDDTLTCVVVGDPNVANTGYGTPFTYWTATDEREARREGWVLTNDSFERMTIARLDDPASYDDLDYEFPVFNNDTEAIAFVVNAALNGSRHHMLAIYLQGFPVRQELDVIPPRRLLRAPPA